MCYQYFFYSIMTGARNELRAESSHFANLDPKSTHKNDPMPLKRAQQVVILQAFGVQVDTQSARPFTEVLRSETD